MYTHLVTVFISKYWINKINVIIQHTRREINYIINWLFKDNNETSYNYRKIENIINVIEEGKGFQLYEFTVFVFREEFEIEKK